MPDFFTLHGIGQMSRQAARERAEKLAVAARDEPVELVRMVCDLEAGRMLCEWVGPDREAVLAYLRSHDLEPRGDQEWLIHVDLEEPPATPPINTEAGS